MDCHGALRTGIHANPPVVGDPGDRRLGHGSARDGMSSPNRTPAGLDICFTVLERPVVAGNCPRGGHP